MDLYELARENEALLKDVRFQLEKLRRKREALVAHKCALERLQMFAVCLAGPSSEASREKLLGPMGPSSPYAVNRHIFNDRLCANNSSFYTETSDHCELSLTNFVKAIRHVLDPFSDAFFQVSEHGTDLIQGEAPPNADEIDLMHLSKFFPRPEERIVWTPLVDEILVSLVTSTGLSDLGGFAGALVDHAGEWARVAEGIETRAFPKARPCVDGSPSRLTSSISAGCCSARWFQVLLPLAARNTSSPGPMIDANSYLSSSDSDWDSQSDAAIVEAVVAAGCITGRVFWMDLTQVSNLVDHAAFAILCRFQRALNPLHVCEKGSADLSRVYFEAMRNSGVSLVHEDYSPRRARGAKRMREFTEIFERLKSSQGDLQSRFCSYVTECYREARRHGLGAPFIVLSPEARVILLSKEQLRAKLRHPGARSPPE